MGSEMCIRDRTKVAPLLEVDEDAEPYAAVIGGLGVSRFEIIINYLLRRGALRRKEKDLEARPWLEPSPEKVEANFGRDLVTAAVLDDSCGGALAAAYALSLSSPSRPLLVGETIAAITSLSPGVTNDPCRRALAALFAVGAAAAGHDDQNRFVMIPQDDVGVCPRGSDEPALLVGANFEIKAPYDLPTATRLRLETFADRTDGGKLLTYTINKYTLYRALDAGIAAAEIHMFLERESGKPLPQNVAFSLADWSTQYGAVGFAQGCFLVTEDEAVGHEIGNLPGLQGLVERPQKWYALAFNDTEYDRVREALLAAGYLPRSLAGRVECGEMKELFYGPAQETTPGATAASSQERIMTTLLFAVAARKRVKLWLHSEADARTGVVETVSHDNQVKLRTDAGISIIAISDIESITLI